jgi:hypothetical protein
VHAPCVHIPFLQPLLAFGQGQNKTNLQWIDHCIQSLIFHSQSITSFQVTKCAEFFSQQMKITHNNANNWMSTCKTRQIQNAFEKNMGLSTNKFFIKHM